MKFSQIKRSVRKKKPYKHNYEALSKSMETAYFFIFQIISFFECQPLKVIACQIYFYTHKQFYFRQLILV